MTLECPVTGCEARLPYVNAKMNSDKTVKVWRRVCPGCGAVVTDTGVFSRSVELPFEYAPEHAGVAVPGYRGEGGMTAW